MNYLDTVRADPCAYCLAPGGSLDHIEPSSRGGANDWTNLASACRSCNSRKGADGFLFALLRPRRERPEWKRTMAALVSPNIRRARLARTMTQRELAVAVGVGAAAVANWEGGVVLPNHRNEEALAAELFGGDIGALYAREAA